MMFSQQLLVLQQLGCRSNPRRLVLQSRKGLGRGCIAASSTITTTTHTKTNATTITFSQLPGLVIYENFVDQNLHDFIWNKTKQASKMAQDLSNEGQSRVSQAHNIPIRSEYVPIQIPLDGFFAPNTSTTQQYCHAEHFSKYGDGHHLTYYRGNENIPSLGLPTDFLDRLGSNPLIENELLESRKRLFGDESINKKEKTWRLTVNYYPSIIGGVIKKENNSGSTTSSSRVGFPWHRDLEVNGASTMILGLGKTCGHLEFGKEHHHNFDLTLPPPKDNTVQYPELVETVQSITLQPGSLLILTGPARWHFVHRVLPGEGERGSLVFGVW